MENLDQTISATGQKVGEKCPVVDLFKADYLLKRQLTKQVNQPKQEKEGRKRKARFNFFKSKKSQGKQKKAPSNGSCNLGNISGQKVRKEKAQGAFKKLRQVVAQYH